MPRLKHKVPSYCHHKASGQAVVTLNGKDHYLGSYGSPESRAMYQRLLAEWLGNQQTIRSKSSVYDHEVVAKEDLQINELLVAYFRHAKTYYVKNGKPTRELSNLKQAARFLVELYGTLRVQDFGPRCLKATRSAMIDAKHCRKVVNARVNRIRRIFKWGVENEMVDASVLHALQSVAPLKYGRSNARESEPIKPVSNHLVDAVRPHTSRQIWAMIQLQRLTGMRSGEVVIMRGSDLDMSGKIWVYQPQDHKTKHHGHQRQIFIGPKAQTVIQPFLKRHLKKYLFSPAEAERLAKRSEARKTPLSCGNKPGTNRRSKPRKQPQERYTPESYLRAIYYACDKAFPHTELSKLKSTRLTAQQHALLKAWRQEHRWHPHQLRHNAATNLRREYGIEAARVILGHRSAAITEVYAELDYAKAAQIMAKVG